MNAFYSGFHRAGMAKVHILRTTPVNCHSSSWARHENWTQAWCGVTACDTTASPKVPVDPCEPLEPGLSWCGPCIGRAAEHAGLLVEVVALLVANEGAKP